MKITTYTYEKVPTSDVELFIPEEPFYCFQTGIRRAVRIIPKFVNWESTYNAFGELYELDVTSVYSSSECKIEKITIPVRMIEDIMNRDSNRLEKSILEMLLNEDYYIRTQEQFEADLNYNIKKITVTSE